MRAHFAGLCAVLACSSVSFADEITLIPAQPVAPTRTEQMQMQGLGVGLDGLTTGPNQLCPPTEAERRRIVDGSYYRSLCGVVNRFRGGVAMPLRCSCWAAEATFFFGGCRAFFSPAYECTRCGPLGGGSFGPIYYGPGGTTAPACNTPLTGLPVSR